MIYFDHYCCLTFSFDAEWRFPFVNMIQSDLNYLFECSMRCKVNELFECEYGLLEVKYLITSHFPSEIVIQNNTHLFESLMVIINNKCIIEYTNNNGSDNNSDEKQKKESKQQRRMGNYYICNLALSCLDNLLDKLQKSLMLRCDVAVMSSPQSKYHQSMPNEMQINDYYYPNQTPPNEIDANNTENQQQNDRLLEDAMVRNVSSSGKKFDYFESQSKAHCVSINSFVTQIFQTCFEKVLFVEDCKYNALKLLFKLYGFAFDSYKFSFFCCVFALFCFVFSLRVFICLFVYCFLTQKMYRNLSEVQTDSIFAIIQRVDSYLNTVDVTQLGKNMFLLHLTDLIAHLMSKIEPHLRQQNVLVGVKQEEEEQQRMLLQQNRVIPSSVVALLSAFVRNVDLSNKYDDLQERVLSLLKKFQPNIVKEIEYVGSIVKALEKLEELEQNSKNANSKKSKKWWSLTIENLRSTFIALPFHSESTKIIVDYLMNMDLTDILSRG